MERGATGRRLRGRQSCCSFFLVIHVMMSGTLAIRTSSLRLAHEQEKCVVVVTHSRELAEQAAVVLRLKKGKNADDSGIEES